MKMQSHARCLSLALAGLLGGWPALYALQATSNAPKTVVPPAAKKTRSSAPEQDAGERKFQQNCSRCHEAPQNLSPRISGTVLRHMRVRASLSQQDERDILRFLNP
jgi:mono/diheme cytochrome c family protein